VFLFLM